MTKIPPPPHGLGIYFYKAYIYIHNNSITPPIQFHLTYFLPPKQKWFFLQSSLFSFREQSHLDQSPPGILDSSSDRQTIHVLLHVLLSWELSPIAEILRTPFVVVPPLSPHLSPVKLVSLKRTALSVHSIPSSSLKPSFFAIVKVQVAAISSKVQETVSRPIQPM